VTPFLSVVPEIKPLLIRTGFGEPFGDAARSKSAEPTETSLAKVDIGGS
jgi:hypothetical protein